MIDLALSVLALVAGGLTVEVYAASSAAPGGRNERGFPWGTDTPHEAQDGPKQKPS